METRWSRWLFDVQQTARMQRLQRQVEKLTADDLVPANGGGATRRPARANSSQRRGYFADATIAGISGVVARINWSAVTPFVGHEHPLGMPAPCPCCCAK
jgi:hypothetical protein